MSTNKSISYLLCNKGIIVNLYKLHFPSFPFSLQPNKRVFHPPTFSPLQLNTQEGKLNIFHPLTFPSSHNFPFSHFSTLPTKRTLIVLPLKLQKVFHFQTLGCRTVKLKVYGCYSNYTKIQGVELLSSKIIDLVNSILLKLLLQLPGNQVIKITKNYLIVFFFLGGVTFFHWILSLSVQLNTGVYFRCKMQKR